MCIYCGTNKYRLIYENHYGPIPNDEFGNTFDIHHIDGNHFNNIPENLQALSIQDHYNIHFLQEDWGACTMILRRVTMTMEELFDSNSKAASNLNKILVENGTHNFLAKNRSKEFNLKQKKIVSDRVQKEIKNGTFMFLKHNITLEVRENQIKANKKYIEESISNGTFHFLQEEFIKSNKEKIKKRVDERKHHCQRENRSESHKKNLAESTAITNNKKLEDGSHILYKLHTEKHTCPHCKFTGMNRGSMKRWHFDNCRSRT